MSTQKNATRIAALKSGAQKGIEVGGDIAAVLGQVMQDIPCAAAICSVVTTIAALAKQVKGNREQCQRLAIRVEVVFTALAPFISRTAHGATPNLSPVFLKGLEQLLATLEACEAVIEKFTRTKEWKRWLTAGNIDEKFKQLVEQLGADQQGLMLGLDVDSFQYREQDRESAKQDLDQLQSIVRDLATQTSDEVRKVGAQISGDVQNVERAIQATIFAQGEEIKHMFLLMQQQLAGAAPAAAAPRAQSASLGVAEITPLDVEIDTAAGHTRATTDNTGVVFAGRWLDEPVSIKRLLPPANSKLSEKDQERCRREVQITASLRHPRILCVYGGSVDENGAMLVTEPIERGSLEALAYSRQLQVPKQAQLCADIAIALEYAHKCKVWHRSLRASACVVTSDWRAKLADFARAKSHAADIVSAKEQADDWRWTAPEAVVNAKSFSAESDMFSFGMLLYEVFVGVAPWDNCVGQTQDALRAAGVVIMSYSKPDAPLALPEVPAGCIAHDLMMRCWQRRSRLRPTPRDAAQVLLPMVSLADQVAGLMDEAKALFQQQDATRGVQVLLRAAQLGSATAHGKLGDVYAGAMKTTVLRDGVRAVSHYEQAAALNDGRAAFNAACLHRAGELVPKNLDKARALFAKAHQLGNAAAAAELAKLDQPK